MHHVIYSCGRGRTSPSTTPPSPAQPAIGSLFLGGKILNCFLVWQVEKNLYKGKKKKLGWLKGNIWVSLGRLHTTTRLRSQAMKRSVTNWSVTKLVQSGFFLFFFPLWFCSLLRHDDKQNDSKIFRGNKRGARDGLLLLFVAVIIRRRHKVATETINSPSVWHFGPLRVSCLLPLRILSFIRSVVYLLVRQVAVEAKMYHSKTNIDSNSDSWRNKRLRHAVVKLLSTLTASRGRLRRLRGVWVRVNLWESDKNLWLDVLHLSSKWTETKWFKWIHCCRHRSSSLEIKHENRMTQEAATRSSKRQNDDDFTLKMTEH